MFTVGGYVSYRAEGVCKISDIRTENFGVSGNDATYYILTPMNDEKTTVFVPVDNERLVAFMRPLLSAEQIVEMAAELRGDRLEWIPESRVRSGRLREILALGDRRELIVLIHTVRDSLRDSIAKGKRPSATDEQALHRATRLLLDEFSATTDLRTEEELLRVLDGELLPNPR